MKKFLLLIVALSAVFSVDAKPKKADTELNLRIGSYNVWSHSARQSKIKKGVSESRSWDNNKKAVAELIVKLDCDLIGMQEVTSVCRDDLTKLVKKSGGKKYKLWWVNTYPEGHKRVVGNAVFYDKKKFKLSEQNIYYFSQLPEAMSKGGDGKRRYRGALTTVVTHKKTGKKFFFIATHGPLKREAFSNAGLALVEFDQKYNKEGLPTIVVGDMNARPGQAFHQAMCAYYEDCYLVAEKTCGTIGTFNGSGESEQNFSKSTRRIDHIYIRSTDKGKLTTKDYKVNRDKYVMPDGQKHYPSDHNPVIVEMTLK